MMGCFNDCTALNLTTCTFIEEEERAREDVRRMEMFSSSVQSPVISEFYDSWCGFRVFVFTFRPNDIV